ncbi:MAG TPA: hypothetical protein VJJ46_12085 [Anaerolineales bacterium]|nr:hypothetical protein [Anaerolineales bacterium]
MMDLAPVRRRVAREMAMADEARAAGREGRARVCARRAAGMAALHHLEQAGAPPRSRSALDALRRLAELEDLPAPLRGAASRLTTRVTEVHDLPHTQDPLADARMVISACLMGEELKD